MAAYYRASVGNGFGADWTYSYTTIALRGDYHFGKFVPVEKLDLYGGLLLGYSIVSISYPASYGGPTGTANILVWGANVGARYFFTRSLAAQLAGCGGRAVGRSRSHD